MDAANVDVRTLASFSARTGGVTFILQGRTKCQSCGAWFDGAILAAAGHGQSNLGGTPLALEQASPRCPACRAAEAEARRRRRA